MSNPDENSNDGLTYTDAINNSPRDLPEGHFVVHTAMNQNFAGYLGSYEQAVELLFGKVSAGEETPDAVGVPLDHHCGGINRTKAVLPAPSPG
jgi:hypothetical protein